MDPAYYFLPALSPSGKISFRYNNIDDDLFSKSPNQKIRKLVAPVLLVVFTIGVLFKYYVR